MADRSGYLYVSVSDSEFVKSRCSSLCIAINLAKAIAIAKIFAIYRQVTPRGGVFHEVSVTPVMLGSGKGRTGADRL